jgi:hypothetical protein
VAPEGRLVPNVKDEALEASDRSSPPLFRSTTLAPLTSPLTVPPTVYELVVQATATFVTLPPPTVPLPLVTVQVCDGDVGWVFTVTA